MEQNIPLGTENSWNSKNLCSMPLPYQTDQAETEGAKDREVSGGAGLRLHQLEALFLISSN